MPSLIPTESLYHAIQSTSYAYADDHHFVVLDPYYLPYWIDYPLPTIDYPLQDFPSYESIMEIMSSD